MFGDSLLVAPIFNEEGIAEYYLPQGTWTNLLSGKIVEGGGYYTEYYDYMSIPCFVKENSIIAMGAVNSTPEYDYVNEVMLAVYGLSDGATAATCVYNMEAKKELTVSVSRCDIEIEIRVKTTANKPYQLYLHNYKNLVSTQLKIEEDDQGSLLTPRQFEQEEQVYVVSLR